jgi:hypothetical protein
MSKSNNIELPEVLAPKTSFGRLDSRGREICDPTPLEIAISASVGQSIGDMVQQLVAKALREHIGGDTIGEDDDDDYEEEEDLSSMSQYTVGLQNRALVEELQKKYPMGAEKVDEADVDPDLVPPDPSAPREARSQSKKAPAPRAGDEAAGAAPKQ